MRSVLTTVIVCSIAASSVVAQGGAPRAKKTQLPVLASDQPDYGPGTLAILSGSGFFPNELVTLLVTHEDGSLPDSGGHEPWQVAANDGGRFTTSWEVCSGDCVGSVLLVRAFGGSGSNAQTLFSDTHECGTGIVTSVVGVGGSCSGFTPAVGSGPDNYEVVEGGTYVITIEGVTECDGDTITVFIQSSDSGNFCFPATGGSGTYVGTFTVPDPACFTMPISYKCGGEATCNHPGSLGAQGPTSGCNGVHLRASIFDSNCVKTGDDTDCEPPPATGACCLVDGTCVEVTEADCTAMNGTYNGDGTVCTGGSCPPASGACCLPDGTCVQVSEADCTAMGGSYNGDLTLCVDAMCPQPTGSCCLPDGTCIDGVTEAECTAMDGAYNGDNTTCMQVGCFLPTGACCLMDGTCVEVTAADCAAMGGNYNGNASFCGETECMQPCFVVDFETDDMGNPMPHGAMIDTEFDCNGTTFPVTITGVVNNSGLNTCAILNSTTGPALQDPDLLVGRGNILILQNDSNLSQCGAGVYCSHNDDENGGTLSFAFCAPVTPTSIVLIDIDGTDAASSVVLTDANGKTRTYTVPGNWTGDRVTNFPAQGWGTLDLTTLAGQLGFASTATAVEQAGFDPNAVLTIDVNLGGSGAVDDLSFCL